MSCTQEQGVFRYDGTPLKSSLKIYYRGEQPLDVRGGATGVVYQFSHLQRMQPVDPKDAVFLLASRLFRLTL